MAKVTKEDCMVALAAMAEWEASLVAPGASAALVVTLAAAELRVAAGQVGMADKVECLLTVQALM